MPRYFTHAHLTAEFTKTEFPRKNAFLDYCSARHNDSHEAMSMYAVFLHAIYICYAFGRDDCGRLMNNLPAWSHRLFQCDTKKADLLALTV